MVKKLLELALKGAGPTNKLCASVCSSTFLRCILCTYDFAVLWPWHFFGRFIHMPVLFCHTKAALQIQLIIRYSVMWPTGLSSTSTWSVILTNLLWWLGANTHQDENDEKANKEDLWPFWPHASIMALIPNAIIHVDWKDKNGEQPKHVQPKKNYKKHN